MPAYKTKFDLSIEDMDLVETALRTASANAEETGVDQKAANDLLGRLHNQKIFFRPMTASDQPYVGG